MKRTKMMTATLALAMMAMGSVTAFAAEAPQQVQLQQYGEDDIITVELQKISAEDVLPEVEGIARVCMSAVVCDTPLEELADVEWINLDGELEVTGQTMTGANGEEIFVKLAKIVDDAPEA